MQHKNGSFSNSFGFILACVGSAVGLGNIWMFPYRLGQYGGSAFLVPYLFFIVLFGITGLSAEFKKIIWPDKQSLVRQTTAVVAVSVVVGLIIALLDFIIQYGVDFLVGLSF